MPNTKMVGYHGTVDFRADSIIKNHKFRPSTKTNEWLGRGIYFFTDFFHAQEWANKQVNRPKNTKNGKPAPAILKVGLVFSSDEYLDLDDPVTYENFEKYIKHVLTRSSNAPDPTCPDWDTASKYEKMCFCCNTFKRLHPEVSIIAYSFTFPPPKGSFVPFGPKQTQLCLSEGKQQRIIQSITKMENQNYEIRY